MDEGQRWKDVKGVGVSGPKQQGQRETSFRGTRKIWPRAGKRFLSVLIRKLWQSREDKKPG